MYSPPGAHAREQSTSLPTRSDACIVSCALCRYPQPYGPGIKATFFNSRVIAKWLIEAMFESLCITFFTLSSLPKVSPQATDPGTRPCLPACCRQPGSRVIAPSRGFFISLHRPVVHRRAHVHARGRHLQPEALPAPVPVAQAAAGIGLSVHHTLVAIVYDWLPALGIGEQPRDLRDGVELTLAERARAGSFLALAYFCASRRALPADGALFRNAAVATGFQRHVPGGREVQARPGPVPVAMGAAT